MSTGLREHAYVAYADELSQRPGLLASWAAVIGGDDPVTLVILPGSWDAARVVAEVPDMLAQAGISEDPRSPSAMLLTGPLDELDYERIATLCQGVYGSALGPRELSQLPRMGLEEITGAASKVLVPEPPVTESPEKPTVRSFDVFDTLIARRCVEPRRVFEIVGARAGIENFAAVRRQAEVNVAHAEHDLDSIYAELGRMLALGLSDVRRIRDLEVAVELEQVIPVAENLAKVRHGDLLVSDMYLPSEVIQSLLRRAGLEKQAGLIVTNDGKHAGTIWPLLKQRVEIEVHEGDNEHSDVRVPRSHGIAALLSTLHQPNPVEVLLRDTGLRSLSEVCRELRLTTMSDDADIRLAQMVQASLNVPLLFIASVRLARLVSEQSVDRVLFSSRDCCAWLALFLPIAERLGLDCSAEYFYTSRLARRHPSASYLEYAAERISSGGIVVDLVGTGWSLAHLADQLELSQLPIFLLHKLASMDQYEQLDPTPGRCDFHAAVDSGDPQLRGAILEACNQTDHGSVVDVVLVDGQVLPVLADDRRSSRVRQLVRAQMEVLRRASEIVCHIDLGEFGSLSSEALDQLILVLYREMSGQSRIWEIYQDALVAEDAEVMSALGAS